MYMDATIKAGRKEDALGTICEVPGDGFTIVHCFGQQYYGNSRKTGKCYTIYEALESCFKEFRKRHPRNKAICPKYIGAGLAGGDWNRIEQLLTKYRITPCDNIDLTKHTYHEA